MINSEAPINSLEDLFAVDPRFSYPWDIVEGRILAGKKITQACQRHINSFDRDDIYFDVDQALKVVRFIEDNAKFTGGAVEGQPYVLLPWAHWVYTSLLCWKRTEDGYRRYRRGFLNTAKGSSKSPLAALIGLRLVFADREPSAQGFVVAATSDQAAVLFSYAVIFARESPKFAKSLKIRGGTDPLYAFAITAKSLKNKSFLKKFSGSSKDGKGKSGFAPSLILVDEIQEITNSSNIDLLTAGVKSRRQPMTLITGNAGVGIGTPSHREYVYAEKVLEGMIEDDTYFAAVYEVDPGYDPYDEEKGERYWIMANPSLPHTPGYEYIRDRVARAKGSPSERSEVDRLCFSRWSEAGVPYFDPAVYDTIEVDELSPIEVRQECPCFLALDLSRIRDLTAGAALWRVDDHWEMEVTSWTPADTIEARSEKDGAPYKLWEAEEYLVALPGAVMDYRYVCEWILKHYALPQFVGMAYDAWNILELQRVMEEVGGGLKFERDENAGGIWYLPHGQGPTANRPKPDDSEDMIRLWMPRTLRSFDRVAFNKEIRILKNPVVRSGILGMVLTKPDPGGNRAIDRAKATVMIDPGMAAVMAVGFGVEYMQRKDMFVSIKDFMI